MRKCCFFDILFLYCFPSFVNRVMNTDYQIITPLYWNIAKKVLKKTMKDGWKVIMAIFALMLLMFAYNSFFGANEYQQNGKDSQEMKSDYSGERWIPLPFFFSWYGKVGILWIRVSIFTYYICKVHRYPILFFFRKNAAHVVVYEHC